MSSLPALGFMALFAAIYVFGFVYPIARIAARVGLSPWISVFALIPGINLLALWVFAFIKWPEVRDEPEQS